MQSAVGHPPTVLAKLIPSSPHPRQSPVHSTATESYHSRATMYNSESIERLSVKTSGMYGETSRVSVKTSQGISPVATEGRFNKHGSVHRNNILI